MINNKTENDISESNLEFPFSLGHYLSMAGVASRRKSCRIIREGNAKVNGEVVTEPGAKVHETDTVSLNNHILTFGKRYYIMLNKPRGYVCTADDPHAEKKALDLIGIPEVRLFTVGRLDKDSEGLLIVTNDGNYANKLSHPRFNIHKVYQVTTDKPLSNKMIKNLCSGINDKGEQLHAMDIKEINSTLYEFTMSEGKKREVRRLVTAVNRKTLRLRRISIGNLSLGNLKPGEWRFLSTEEIHASSMNSIP